MANLETMKLNKELTFKLHYESDSAKASSGLLYMCHIWYIFVDNNNYSYFKKSYCQSALIFQRLFGNGTNK